MRWGHSQGGHAALFTADGGQERAPELELQAAVSFAPGSRTSDTAAYFASGDPNMGQALSFLPVLLLGAEAADPSISAEAMLTESALPLIRAARSGCMDDVRAAAATVPVDQVFTPEADMGRIGEYFATQELEPLTSAVPTLVVQGTADVLVSRPITDRIVDALCGNGAELTYRVYDGADHRGVLETSFDDVQAFVETCGQVAHPTPPAPGTDSPSTSGTDAYRGTVRRYASPDGARALRGAPVVLGGDGPPGEVDAEIEQGTRFRQCLADDREGVDLPGPDVGLDRTPGRFDRFGDDLDVGPGDLVFGDGEEHRREDAGIGVDR